MSRAAPRLFTIAPGVPFLRTLAETLLAGGLVPGWRFDGDPLALADVTIYLPTRRAARELRSAFIDVLGGGAAILPAIRPLGEFDTTPDMSEEDVATLPDLPLPVGDLERVLALAPLVQAWKRRIPAQTASLIGEDLVVPASTADAIWLARDLSALLDEIETEQGDWSKLGTLVPDELAAWWQLSLSFLEIVTHHWPDHLAAIGKSSPAAWRNAGLKAEADRLRRKGSAGPVIAAGSTGSIPATADLLAAIATLDQGAVVLPGLDLALDEEAWQAVAVPGAPPASFGHPQTQLKRLLTRLGAERSEIISLGQASTTLAARAGLVSEAMRPAETTERWAERASFFASALDAGALDGVDLVEAANEREEALAIAIALRLAIKEEGRTAALVTGDRALARPRLRRASSLRHKGRRFRRHAARPSVAVDTSVTRRRDGLAAGRPPCDPLPAEASLARSKPAPRDGSPRCRDD
jgi:ATP-dependent helicase/nuclease subunit B